MAYFADKIDKNLSLFSHENCLLDTKPIVIIIINIMEIVASRDDV